MVAKPSTADGLFRDERVAIPMRDGTMLVAIPASPLGVGSFPSVLWRILLSQALGLGGQLHMGEVE